MNSKMKTKTSSGSLGVWKTQHRIKFNLIKVMSLWDLDSNLGALSMKNLMKTHSGLQVNSLIRKRVDRITKFKKKATKRRSKASGLRSSHIQLTIPSLNLWLEGISNRKVAIITVFLTLSSRMTASRSHLTMRRLTGEVVVEQQGAKTPGWRAKKSLGLRSSCLICKWSRTDSSLNSTRFPTTQRRSHRDGASRS